MLVIHLVSDWGGGSRIFSEMGGGWGGLNPSTNYEPCHSCEKSFNSKQGLSMLTAWPHPNSIDIAPQGLQHKGATRPEVTLIQVFACEFYGIFKNTSGQLLLKK